MFKPSEFRDLVSGRRRGLWAAVLRGVLRAAEAPYTLAVARRNRRYDQGASAVHRAGVPVVSVGNLTLGGTGKTPLVHWIAGWFHDRGIRAAVISRGYRAGAQGTNDEALELRQRLPDVPHIENPDRVAAAREAVARFGVEVLVLDDAFQHRRIARDLDVVLIDALEPFGFGHVFPRGTLREPVGGLGRADVVVLSRADLLDAGRRAAIECRVRSLCPEATWLEVTHQPETLLAAGGATSPVDSLRGRSVAAFCGLGNPAGFRHTLGACGYRVAGFRELPDHHRYDQADLASLAAWAEGLDVDAVVCTRKDLVKLGVDRLGSRPLWALSIGIGFTSGKESLEKRLQDVLARGRQEAGN
ncbi:MAG: tetraacyldisaccharide 4'-kinase [Pirellulales bacterium]|nr:tetraacyldisaccharide 4'-kinase [Pirellulales bacterium]